MRKIISIILIAIMFALGVSSVYADDPEVYTASDLVYSLNSYVSNDPDYPPGFNATLVSFDEMESLCEQYNIPFPYTSLGSPDFDPYPMILGVNQSGTSTYACCAEFGYDVNFHITTKTTSSGNIYNDYYYLCYDTNRIAIMLNGVMHTGSYSGSYESDWYRRYWNIYVLDSLRFYSDSLYFRSNTDDLNPVFWRHEPVETINGGLVSLQSGNALVIDTLGGDISQIGLFTTLPVKSSVFSAFRSGASYFATNDLNSIKSIDFNTHAFTWNKQEGTTGILGQTDKGVYTINNPSGGRYLVIVNPRYMPRGSDHFLTNNPITVAISGTYKNLFRFSLSQSDATLVTLADQGESLIETDEGGTNSFGGSVTFNDIPDTDPLPSDTPVIAWGTGNTPDYSEVPSLDGSVIGQATENLQGIRSDFNGFFGVIRDCISWLPPQLITLLVAAMSLLVAVGIVKALL